MCMVITIIGCIPEDDDPATFDDYSDAVGHMNELVDAACGYYRGRRCSATVEVGWASTDSTMVS